MMFYGNFSLMIKIKFICFLLISNSIATPKKTKVDTSSTVPQKPGYKSKLATTRSNCDNGKPVNEDEGTILKNKYTFKIERFHQIQKSEFTSEVPYKHVVRS